MKRRREHGLSLRSFNSVVRAPLNGPTFMPSLSIPSKNSVAILKASSLFSAPVNLAFLVDDRMTFPASSANLTGKWTPDGPWNCMENFSSICSTRQRLYAIRQRGWSKWKHRKIKICLLTGSSSGELDRMLPLAFNFATNFGTLYPELMIDLSDDYQEM